MNEPSYAVDWRVENKVYLALILMVILISAIYGTERYAELHANDRYYEHTHDMTVWAIPENYIYVVEIEFCSSREDAYAGQNVLMGTGVTVRPDMPEKIEQALYGLPVTYSGFWVRVGFGYELAENEWQWTYDYGSLQLGVETSFYLEGRVFTILVTAHISGTSNSQSLL